MTAPRGLGLPLVAALAVALAVAACGPAATAPPVGAAAAGGPPLESAAATSAATSGRLVIGRAAFDLPVPLTRAVAFPATGAIVVAGGLGLSGTTGRVERVDLASGAWAATGRLVDPVHDAGGAVLGAADVVVGGGRTTQGATVQRLRAGRASVVIGRLPAPRADLAAVAVGGRLVIVGGGAAGRPDRRVLATTDGIHQRLVTLLPVGVRYAAVAVLGGRVWVVGGATPTGDTTAIQLVDPTAGTARVAGRLPVGLSHATALVLGGRLFVAGGRHAGRAQAMVLEVDPASGRASLVGRLPVALSDAAGVVVGGVGYLLGGETSRPVSTVLTLRLA